MFKGSPRPRRPGVWCQSHRSLVSYTLFAVTDSTTPTCHSILSFPSLSFVLPVNTPVVLVRTYSSEVSRCKTTLPEGTAASDKGAHPHRVSPRPYSRTHTSRDGPSREDSETRRDTDSHTSSRTPFQFGSTEEVRRLNSTCSLGSVHPVKTIRRMYISGTAT